MKKIIDCLKNYICDEVTMTDWNNEAKNKLSLNTLSLFNFYLLNILHTDFLILEPKEDEYTVEKLEKNECLIEEKTGYICIFALKKISYMIKRFIKDKIAFIVEDNQISIPSLVMRIKLLIQEKKETERLESFTPFFQLIYLYLLYSKKNEFYVSELSKKLSISAMSILRAMEIFENLGLIKSEIGGLTNRKKIFYKNDQAEFFEIGKKYLINPVKKVLYVSNIPNNLNIFKSDLTALSEKTMLSEPKRKIYAIYQNQKVLKKYTVSEEIANENNLPMIQIMKYDISFLTKDDCVDPITLIEGLKDNDERIEMAISELMEGYKWFTE